MSYNLKDETTAPSFGLLQQQELILHLDTTSKVRFPYSSHCVSSLTVWPGVGLHISFNYCDCIGTRVSWDPEAYFRWNMPSCRQGQKPHPVYLKPYMLQPSPSHRVGTLNWLIHWIKSQAKLLQSCLSHSRLMFSWMTIKYKEPDLGLIKVL